MYCDFLSFEHMLVGVRVEVLRIVPRWWYTSGQVKANAR
jgi:hypothetical protein